MNKHLLKYIVLTILTYGSFSSAYAGLLGIYGGYSMGNSTTTNTTPSQTSSISKLYAGYRVLGPLAVEMSQNTLGTYASGLIKADGTSIDAVGFLPLGIVTVFAKAGILNWNVSVSGTPETGMSTKYGYGIEYGLFANIDLRLEYELYSKIGKSVPVDATAVTLGIGVAF